MDEQRGTGLPASIEAAWGLRDRPNKGPKPGLSLDRIVAAAVRVAEAEGLEAVSMSRVAAELGAATMSLYRYVAAKDELVTMMFDAAIGLPPDEPVAGGWRAALSNWAWRYLELTRRHPWVVRIKISGPPLTPNNLAWFERGLRALRDTGLTAGEKVSAILLISGHVRAVATLDADLAEAIAASHGPPVWASYGRLITTLTTAEQFPALHELIAAGAFDEVDPEQQDPNEDFAFGLERVLDGIEALIRSRSAPGTG